MNKSALVKILHEMKNCPEYKLEDLFKIRDALVILQGYGLADMDLLLEVMKYINQKAENNP
jgi:hypothetical protein